jgi:hypothetical protein
MTHRTLISRSIRAGLVVLALLLAALPVPVAAAGLDPGPSPTLSAPPGGDPPAALATASAAEVETGGGTALPLGMGLFAIGMVALAKERDTPKRDGKLLSYPVAAARKVYAGALTVLSGGYAQGGVVALGLKAIGRANETVDNSAGAAGALSVQVERGTFKFAQDGTITQADVGSTCYILDDQTVSRNDRAGGDAAATRSPAGPIRGIESGGVWVEI